MQLCKIVDLKIVIKIIEISLQECLKNFKHEYQNNFSKALSEYLVINFLLLILNMFLLTGILFQVKNLLQGLIKGLHRMHPPGKRGKGAEKKSGFGDYILKVLRRTIRGGGLNSQRGRES